MLPDIGAGWSYCNLIHLNQKSHCFSRLLWIMKFIIWSKWIIVKNSMFSLALVIIRVSFDCNDGITAWNLWYCMSNRLCTACIAKLENLGNIASNEAICQPHVNPWNHLKNWNSVCGKWSVSIQRGVNYIIIICNTCYQLPAAQKLVVQILQFYTMWQYL